LGDFESLVQNEALQNPYTSKITIRENFLHLSPLQNIITDTHYDERNRIGRHIVFIARVLADYKPNLLRGIGIDRDVAVCFELDGTACVYSDRNFKAHFLAVNDLNSTPEVLSQGMPLTWNNNKKAIENHEIIGDEDGSQCFNMNQWNPIGDSVFKYYYVVDGKVFFDY
jgi:cyanophycinase